MYKGGSNPALFVQLEVQMVAGDPPAIVIGAGIFGSLIARALEKAGRSALVIDDRQSAAGSRPAACLMRPSWFSSVGKGVYEPALRKLDELVGVKDLTFKITVGSTTVHWCDPQKVLLPVDRVTRGRVTKIVSRGKLWDVELDMPEKRSVVLGTSLLVVAAGIWTPTLVAMGTPVTAQAGAAWLFPRDDIAEPFIRVWAPYKQVVAFNRGDGLWVGDGMSVQDWTAARRAASYNRCQDAVGKTRSEPIELFGYRPYVKDAKPCYLKQLKKGLWVATGGAKNGTLAAGWCADQIVRAI